MYTTVIYEMRQIDWAADKKTFVICHPLCAEQQHAFAVALKNRVWGEKWWLESVALCIFHFK